MAKIAKITNLTEFYGQKAKEKGKESFEIWQNATNWLE